MVKSTLGSPPIKTIFASAGLSMTPTLFSAERRIWNGADSGPAWPASLMARTVMLMIEFVQLTYWMMLALAGHSSLALKLTLGSMQVTKISCLANLLQFMLPRDGGYS